MRFSIKVCFLGLSLLVFVSVGLTPLRLTNDSANYLHAGSQIRAFDTPTRIDGVAYNEWAPLYATLIGWAWDEHILVKIHLAHAFIALLILWSFTSLLFQLTRDSTWVWGIWLLALANPHRYVLAFVWSEGLFILLAVWVVLALQQMTWRRVMIGALLASLLAMQRYIGIMMILAGCIEILRLTRNPYKVVAFGVVSALPIGLWVLRNIALTGFAFGERIPSLWTLGQNIELTLGVIGAWFPVGLWAIACGIWVCIKKRDSF